MVERIEKVNRVKGVDYDVNRPFERKEGYGDGTGKDSAFSADAEEADGKEYFGECSDS